MSKNCRSWCWWAFLVITFTVVLLIEPIQMAGGGRGIAVTAKGGKGKNVARPHDPNESNGSWSVVLVVILPVAQMFLMVILCFALHHCYTKYCLKVMCGCKRGSTSKTFSKRKIEINEDDPEEEEKDNCAVPMTSFNSIWHTNNSHNSTLGPPFTRSNGTNGINQVVVVPSNDLDNLNLTDIVISPPELYQNSSSSCPVHLVPNGCLPYRATSTTTTAMNAKNPVTTTQLSANGSIRSNSAQNVQNLSASTRIYSNQHKVSCSVHTTTTSGTQTYQSESFKSNNNRKIYPTISHPYHHHHHPLVHSNSLYNSSNSPPFFTTNVISSQNDAINELELLQQQNLNYNSDNDSEIPEIQELFYPDKPPCRVHNPPRSVSAVGTLRTGPNWSSSTRIFMNSH